MRSKDFLKFCTKTGHKAHEVYMSDLFKNGLVEGEWVIVGPKMLWPQNSESTIKNL